MFGAGSLKDKIYWNKKNPNNLHQPTNQSKSCLVKHEMLYVANYWSYIIDGYSILKHFLKIRL